MVDPSKRWPESWRYTVGIARRPCSLLAALLLCGVFSANAQAPPSTRAGEAQVTRLQDSLASGDDWEIGVPRVEPESSFASSVRDGRALDSEAYLTLDRDLRQVRQRLQARPDDPGARRRLAEIRSALVERIEINIDFDYLYAAAVYIELLRQAEGSLTTVRQLSRRLDERRTALSDSG